MTTIVEIEKTKMEFESIHEAYRTEFIAQVLASYAEYMELVQYPEIPEALSMNEDFFEAFYPAYILACSSEKLNLFPDSGNRNLDDAEREVLDRHLLDDSPMLEFDVVSDIVKVFDMFQMFYITTQWEYIHHYSEMTAGRTYHNSPLQEVW